VKLCAVPGCGGKHYATAKCKKHYTQVARHGRLTPDRERGAVRVCSAPGCERIDTIRHDDDRVVLCRKHLRQVVSHGRLTPEREHLMDAVGCAAKDCPEPHRAKGFCVRHYNAARWAAIKAKLAKYPHLGRGQAFDSLPLPPGAPPTRTAP
jgi:hypothetical protein